MTRCSYPFLDIPDREGKPRKLGKTMVHDGGISPRQLEMILETAAPYIDYYKFQSTHCLIPEDITLTKAKMCRENDITLYMGGNVAELAWAQGRWDQVLAYALNHGWGAFEVSNTYVPFSEAQMIDMVKRVSAEGLEVFYEWGKKHPAEPLDPDAAAADIKRFLDAGASVVVLEEGEVDLLIGKDGQGEHADRLIALFEKVGLEHLMIEAGNIKQMAWLMTRFGPTISIGNLKSEQVIDVEPLRRGIGRLVDNFIYEPYLGKSN
ncbi:MAG: phosphosulfolactate synthase [Rhodospirillales bacterium]